eukprot:jgi/Mesvir1/15957/Mv08272-RA.1
MVLCEHAARGERALFSSSLQSAREKLHSIHGSYDVLPRIHLLCSSFEPAPNAWMLEHYTCIRGLVTLDDSRLYDNRSRGYPPLTRTVKLLHDFGGRSGSHHLVLIAAAFLFARVYGARRGVLFLCTVLFLVRSRYARANLQVLFELYRRAATGSQEDWEDIENHIKFLGACADDSTPLTQEEKNTIAWDVMGCMVPLRVFEIGPPYQPGTENMFEEEKYFEDWLTSEETARQTEHGARDARRDRHDVWHFLVHHGKTAWLCLRFAHWVEHMADTCWPQRLVWSDRFTYIPVDGRG